MVQQIHNPRVARPFWVDYVNHRLVAILDNELIGESNGKQLLPINVDAWLTQLFMAMPVILEPFAAKDPSRAPKGSVWKSKERELIQEGNMKEKKKKTFPVERKICC